MKNFSDVEAYEHYSSFQVYPRNYPYWIMFQERGTGTAGDSLYNYFSAKFMTYDHVSSENNRDCIAQLGSGFWHDSCNSQIARNNLNGIYSLGKGKQGIWWGTFGNLSVQNTSPLKTVQMMVHY
uniref:Ficolin-1 n=1 Tax=Culex pipiens TaxID=7175 RepID=A0A8D8JWA8_CULPI